MKLSTDEIEILKWAEPDGMCAIVWPIGANDTLYLAGKRLEGLGFLENIQHSPERWTITAAGRKALALSRPHHSPTGD
jgi:hypothetical protein